MRAALTKAAEEIAAWCDAHPESYPPTILHVTDGESGDGDPEEIAASLGQLRTNDGSVVVMNIHVSALGSDTIKFPSSESGLPDNYAKMLFRMSSALPPHIAAFARDILALRCRIHPCDKMLGGCIQRTLHIESQAMRRVVILRGHTTCRRIGFDEVGERDTHLDGRVLQCLQLILRPRQGMQIHVARHDLA